MAVNLAACLDGEVGHPAHGPGILGEDDDQQQEAHDGDDLEDMEVGALCTTQDHHLGSSLA